MNTATNEIAAPKGDWDLRGLDGDQIFARSELSDDALTAACWATAKFHATFPGWQLYRRIAAGMTIFDDELDAWAVGGARLLARARKRTKDGKQGRRYIEARGPWIDQAARDALASVVAGYRVNTAERARVCEIEPRTYLKIYKPMLAAMVIGLETYRSELHANYRRVKFQTFDSGDMVVREGCDFARVVDFQSGNRITPHSSNSDNLHAPFMPDVLK